MGLSFRSFPIELRIGTDLSSIRRWEVLLRTTSTGSVSVLAKLRRWMTPFEFSDLCCRLGPDAVRQLEYAKEPLSKAQEVNTTSTARFLAGRWSAKEAIIKAVKPRKLTMRDIEVRRDPQTREVFAVVFDAPVPLWKRNDYEAAVARLSRGTSEGATRVTPVALSTAQQSEESQTTLPSSRPARQSDATQTGVHSHLNVNPYEYEQELTGQVVPVTITHDGDYACAVALATPDHSDT